MLPMVKSGPFQAAMLLAASLGLFGGKTLLANPAGPTIRHGDIRIQSSGDALRILQNSRQGIIDWNSFSIQNGETVRFIQPNANSATLNRVTGTTVSQIDGNIRANGHVFLLNPNGIVVGRTGSIDAAGFAASTLDLEDEEFLAGGDLSFKGNSEEAVINLGSIGASNGDILLIASTVENDGLLRAPNGTVALAAGNDVLVKESGSERVFVRGAGGTPKENGVVNSGTIEANVAELKSYGGNVYGMAVRNEGRVAATGVSREGGQIFLRAGGGTVRNTGQLVAKKPAARSGGRVTVDSGEGGRTEVGGTVDAGGESGAGGTVLILGDTVDLFPESLILADGDTAGGAIQIGGGRAGLDPGIRNSIDVTVGPGALLNASANESGNGGEVIVFASRLLDFSGHAAARGGAFGGDGGFVELSGKESVRFPSLVESVDVSASNGKSGTLLIDPNDIFIGASINDFITDPEFGPSPISADYILDTDIATFLQSVGNLIIQTDVESSGGIGNITFTSGSVITWSSGNNFSVQAHSEVIVEDQVMIDATGSGSVNLYGRDGVSIQGENATGSSISTQSGSIILRTDANRPLGRGVSVHNASLTTAGGNIEIMGYRGNPEDDGSGGDFLNSALSTGSGNITVLGSNLEGDGVRISGSSISSTSGEISVTGIAGGKASSVGIHVDDTFAFPGMTTSIGTGNNGQIKLAGMGNGMGEAILFVDPESTLMNVRIVDGDGTQDVDFESLGGNVDVFGVYADAARFADPDGVGLNFRMHSSDVNSFTAVNVGGVDIQNLDSLEIREIKLATEARFAVSMGDISVTESVEAGQLVEFAIGDYQYGDFYISAPITSPVTRYDGSAFDVELGYGGSGINVNGTFDLEGVQFQDILQVGTFGSGTHRLLDSSLDSVINVSVFDPYYGLYVAPIFDPNSDIAEVVAPSGGVNTITIRGMDFNGFDKVSGQGGNDHFILKIDDGMHFDGTLHGGSGNDIFEIHPGGGVGEIIGGVGNDTIDYSAFQSGVTANFDSASGTQIDRVHLVENVIGGQGIDRIIGRRTSDEFRVTGENSGSVNGHKFSGFEILDGNAGSDKFRFLNQGTLSGGVIGGAGVDGLILDDRNLGGVNRYTISGSTIQRNPTYRFNGVEVLQLLLGPGNDTVVTRGNGQTMLLDGGKGYDTLEMGPNRYLQQGAILLGGSTIVASNFEAPVKEGSSAGSDNSNSLLTTQTSNVPVLQFKDGSKGESVDNFSQNNPGSPTNLNNNSNPPPGGGGGAFGAAAAASIAAAGQAAVLVIEGDRFRLEIPSSLDGLFGLPPEGSIEELLQNLTPEAWTELADAIEFEGGMILVLGDGPYAIDLTGLPPAAVLPLLQGNLDFAAALELAGALELTLAVPVTSFDGPVGIAQTVVDIDPATAALLAELLNDGAFGELADAIGMQ